jgi:hypothetical protein
MKQLLGCLLLFAAIAGGSARADILLSNFSPAYTQNFNTLASTGTSTIVPFGWRFTEIGGNTTYAAGNGSANQANTYSFGTTGSPDRAFGEITSGGLTSIIGARFTNDGTASISFLTVTYTGEQWRVGGNNSAGDKLDFQISTDATSLTTGTWFDVNVLDFVGPVSSPNNSAINGNLAANRVNLASGKFALPSSVAPGASFWIRWTSSDVPSQDHGLAVDDFSIQAVPASIPAGLTGALVGLVALFAVRKRNAELIAE